MGLADYLTVGATPRAWPSRRTYTAPPQRARLVADACPAPHLDLTREHGNRRFEVTAITV
jgi:hypothetical protein